MTDFYPFFVQAAAERFNKTFKTPEALYNYIKTSKPQQKQCIFGITASFAQSNRNAVRKWFFGSFSRQFCVNLNDYKLAISDVIQGLVKDGNPTPVSTCIDSFKDLGLNMEQLYQFVRYQCQKLEKVVFQLRKVRKCKKANVKHETEIVEIYGQLANFIVDEDDPEMELY